MGLKKPADHAATRPDVAAMDPVQAFRAGFRAGLSAAESFRSKAVASAVTELASFKATSPEFYADVREEMAAAFEREALGKPWPASLHAAAMAEAIRRDHQDDERAVLEQLKRSRFRGHNRQTKDIEDVGRFAELIRAGEVTKTAAAKMGIGMERAKRLRELAVESGLLTSRRT